MGISQWPAASGQRTHEQNKNEIYFQDAATSFDRFYSGTFADWRQSARCWWPAAGGWQIDGGQWPEAGGQGLAAETFQPAG